MALGARMLANARGEDVRPWGVPNCGADCARLRSCRVGVELRVVTGARWGLFAATGRLRTADPPDPSRVLAEVTGVGVYCNALLPDRRCTGSYVVTHKAIA